MSIFDQCSRRLEASDKRAMGVFARLTKCFMVRKVTRSGAMLKLVSSPTDIRLYRLGQVIGKMREAQRASLFRVICLQIEIGCLLRDAYQTAQHNHRSALISRHTSPQLSRFFRLVKNMNYPDRRRCAEALGPPLVQL